MQYPALVIVVTLDKIDYFFMLGSTLLFYSFYLEYADFYPPYITPLEWVSECMSEWLTDPNELGWEHVASKSASPNLLLLRRSLSAQLGSVFPYVRLIAFILHNSGVEVLFGVIFKVDFNAVYAFWIYFIFMLLLVHKIH
jgi:hypothetical protein